MDSKRSGGPELITGQNPASAVLVGKTLLEKLK